MLIIIGIIGVLAALLMGGLSAAGRASRKTRCVANLKGIGQSLASYSADYNGFVMRFETSDDTTPDVYDDYPYQWYSVLLKRMTNDPGGSHIRFPAADRPDVPRTAEVFRCPEDKDYLFGRDKLSYGLNTDVRKSDGTLYTSSNAGSATAADKRSDYYNMSQLNSASNFILIAETGRIQSDTYTHRAYRAWISNSLVNTRPVSGVHSGQASILWGDYSVHLKHADAATENVLGNVNHQNAFPMWSVANE